MAAFGHSFEPMAVMPSIQNDEATCLPRPRIGISGPQGAGGLRLASGRDAASGRIGTATLGNALADG